MPQKMLCAGASSTRGEFVAEVWIYSVSGVWKACEAGEG